MIFKSVFGRKVKGSKEWNEVRVEMYASLVEWKEVESEYKVEANFICIQEQMNLDISAQLGYETPTNPMFGYKKGNRK